MLRGWSRNAENKSKMVDGRHLEKSKNHGISATTELILTTFGTVMHPGILDIASH